MSVDPEQLARVRLEAIATVFLGPQPFQGVSDREIHERVIRAVNPTANLEGRTDDYVAGRFDSEVTYIAERVKPPSRLKAIRARVHGPRRGGRS
jgi:hypothetical protein